MSDNGKDGWCDTGSANRTIRYALDKILAAKYFTGTEVRNEYRYPRCKTLENEFKII